MNFYKIINKGSLILYTKIIFLIIKLIKKFFNLIGKNDFTYRRLVKEILALVLNSI